MTEPQRLVGMRSLLAAIEQLDDENLLDQHARDRVLTLTVGALRTEVDAARQRRFFRRLRGAA